MRKLTEFNSKVSHDLQDVTDTTRNWGDGKSTLVKTLHYSVVVLELLGSFIHFRDALDGTASGSALGLGNKVDTDIALQLLSCNMNVCNMYRRLYTELTTQGWQPEEAQALPALRLEGLQALNIEMRHQVLVHMCSLTFGKIQRELELIRRRGLLTQTADRTFQIVLGGGNEGATGPAFGMEQIVDNFRGLLMARELLTS